MLGLTVVVTLALPSIVPPLLPASHVTFSETAAPQVSHSRHHRYPHGQRTHNWNRRRPNSFLFCDAAFRRILTMLHRNNCASQSRLYCNRKRRTTRCGCAASRMICSMSHRTGCARRTRNPSCRNSCSTSTSGAARTNTASNFHNCNYGRSHRSFRISSGRRHRNNRHSHWPCSLRAADFAAPKCGCRRRGRSSCPLYQLRGFVDVSPKILCKRSDNIYCTRHGRALHGFSQHRRLAVNFACSSGKCQRRMRPS